VTELAPQEIRTFFVTTVTANRRRIFQTDANAQLLLSVLNDDREGALSAPRLRPDAGPHSPSPHAGAGRLHRESPAIHQRRIGSPHDFAAHRDYIHANPVRAHLCACPEDFPFSSASDKFAMDPTPVHLHL
jgi:putative transposase